MHTRRPFGELYKDPKSTHANYKHDRRGYCSHSDYYNGDMIGSTDCRIGSAKSVDPSKYFSAS